MLNIYSKELSSFEAMQELFEKYCMERCISMDFSKEDKYNNYVHQETASAFIWWIRGVFAVLVESIN